MKRILLAVAVVALLAALTVELGRSAAGAVERAADRHETRIEEALSG
jgi:hypothetical protein